MTGKRFIDTNVVVYAYDGVIVINPFAASAP